MLLKWPDLAITGVTTTAEEHGRRAGYAHYVLQLMDRGEVPVAAGADLSDGYCRYDTLGYPDDAENWPEPIAPRPAPIDDALDILKHSIEQGARLVGIGSFTNFRLLDEKYPGILRDADLYLMGGYVYDIPAGFPAWKNNYDWNIQLDVRSALYVLEHANPTLIPLTLTCQTALRRAELPCLAQAGELGELLVRQAELFDRTEHLAEKYGIPCAGLPDDMINFHHDPLACAVALDWRDGVEIETVPLKFEVKDSYLHEVIADDGKPTRVVTKIDAAAFNAYWLDIVCQPDLRV
jgi:inosine-uridine nucleoside N-ribohydrolase